MSTRDEYIIELRKIRTTLEAFTNLSKDLATDFTDSEIQYIEEVIKRGDAVFDIIQAINATLESFTTEQARHSLPDIELSQPPAQKSDTLLLMNYVARHLSGRDVEVRIEQPRNNYPGMCVWGPYDSEHAIKLQISPRAVAEGERYLDIFLHEVAHAKLHTGPGQDIDQAEKIEREAMRQTAAWKHYAQSHSAPMEYMPDVGGNNPAANYFRLQLLTLLGSQEAAELTIGR